MENEIFCREGLDSPNQIESLQQIKFYAHAISVASGPGKRSGAQKTDHVICPTGQIRSGVAQRRTTSGPAAGYFAGPKAGCSGDTQVSWFVRWPGAKSAFAPTNRRGD
jgi:hypothetical protein